MTDREAAEIEDGIQKGPEKRQVERGGQLAALRVRFICRGDVWGVPSVDCLELHVAIELKTRGVGLGKVRCPFGNAFCVGIGLIY